MRWLKRLFCAHTWRPCPIEYWPSFVDPLCAIDARDGTAYAYAQAGEPLHISRCIRCGKVVQHYGPLLSFEELEP